ncbi:TetR/AcrR family transcriptional regulator [Tomitella biformata]|uniref:TetR/AcrR family transcriptional regulator n=1 Tax=Tomitella biformata TaxID=630403 RepID=UPI00046514CD|nr:TetR/AcrR family transcriptional regulator [Tomitella biformata]
MSANPITRRASYGPSSPEIGTRGANTRSKIVDVSLDLFSQVGFFNTSVDAIAKAADISRATLYQYFPGKDEIFIELLEECGRALFRVARRIGPLGPTEVGFDNLNWWLGEWSWVFEKYSTMFIQWTAVASSDTAVRPQISRFIGGYNNLITTRLETSEIDGIDPVAGAMVMQAMVHRMNLFMHTGRVYGRDTQSIIDAVSVYLQLVLFPDTPASVLNSLALRPSGGTEIAIPEPPSTEGLTTEDRIAGLSTRAVKTVRTLIEAGATQFREKGYHRTSVDDIVEEAGFARGTFYKYFSEKQDLLVTLSTQALDGALDLAERIRHIDPMAEHETALRQWIADMAEFSAHYAGSIDAWTQEGNDRDLVYEFGAHGQGMMDASLFTLIDRKRDYPLDPVLAAVLFRALVSRVPAAAQELPEPMSEEQFVDLIILCIRRGFFSHLLT